jgi:hypothetical protein
MAAKTPTKIRNPERGNNKAWSKSHNAPVKALSAEAQERKAKKDVKRAQVVRYDRGASITMPRITWGWVAETMSGRLTQTRRFRTVEIYMAQERRGRKSDDQTFAIESNPEVKTSRKNGR